MDDPGRPQPPATDSVKPAGAARLKRVGRRLLCTVVGHRKVWRPKVLPPFWDCERCHETGGVEEHERMSVIQFLGFAMPGVIFLIIVVALLRLLLG